ncbi:hypothetical protein BU23DRAFT_408834, partial [Bimuria novae-zelandiae CBS 107.79]
VTFEVGLEHKKYMMHKSLLRYYSDYFAKCLDDDQSFHYNEAEEQPLVLEDISTNAFDVFQTWVYSQEIHIKLKQHGKTKVQRAFDNTLATFTGAWMLGDRFQASAFKTALNIILVDEIRRDNLTPSPQCITYAFKTLPEHSVVLKLLVEQYC